MVKCPENIEELEELEKLLPMCRRDLYEQAQARLNTGTAKSEKQVSIQLGEELGRKPESVRRSIQREKKSRGVTVSQPKISMSVFNETNDMVGWARWTWNPYTGCEHGCKYCYARDIANRFYKEKFKPTFRPHRLKQPQNTPLPKQKGWHRRVFVCSMADLFGNWVDRQHINQILQAAGKASDWEFLYLTKNPSRLVHLDWPQNSWVGATVDTQTRVEPTEKAFNQIDGVKKFLSIEPFTEKLSFTYLSEFDLIMIGGRSRSSKMPAARPSLAIMVDLLEQAHIAGVTVWIKSNVNPLETP